MQRRLKIKIPAILVTSYTPIHREAKRRDEEDQKQRVQEQEIQVENRVLIKQQKTTIKPPFDSEPYIVDECRKLKSKQ